MVDCAMALGFERMARYTQIGAWCYVTPSNFNVMAFTEVR